MNIPKQWKLIALFTVIVYLLFVAAIEYAKRDVDDDGATVIPTEVLQ